MSAGEQRVRAGTGISTDSRPAEAAKQAADQAMGESRIARASVAVCFAALEEPTEENLAAVRDAVGRVTGCETVVGGLAGGVLTQEGEIEKPPACAVMAIQAPAGLIVPFFQTFEEGPEESARGAAARLSPGLRPGASSVMWADPLGFQPEFVEHLQKRLGGVPIYGGGTSGAEEGGAVFCGGNLSARAAAGLFLLPPLAVLSGVAQACRRLSEFYFVTKARRNVVLELDGQPAFQKFQTALDKLPASAVKSGQAVILAGIREAGEPEEMKVRPILAVDPAAGAVAVSEFLREGQSVAFLLRDADAARRSLEEMVSAEKEKIREGGTPAFGFYFNCQGRGRHLYGSSDEDTGRIRRALGEFPLIGFFTSFELAPSARGETVHGFTGVLALFQERG